MCAIMTCNDKKIRRHDHCAYYCTLGPEHRDDEIERLRRLQVASRGLDERSKKTVTYPLFTLSYSRVTRFGVCMGSVATLRDARNAGVRAAAQVVKMALHRECDIRSYW